MSAAPVFSALLQTLETLLQKRVNEVEQDKASILFIADENTLDDLALLAPYAKHPAVSRCTVLTNRYDVAEQSRALSLTTYYSDYRFDELESASFDMVIFRVSKERPVCHHILNSLSGLGAPHSGIDSGIDTFASQPLLNHDGHLLIGGKKDEGTKNYVDKANKVLGYRGKVKKDGLIYTADLRPALPETPISALDDKNYCTLRPCINGTSLHSKPGVYGWDKLDKGSQFLMDYIRKIAPEELGKREYILDLGCGYGYLSCEALDILSPSRSVSDRARTSLKGITATDNNAGAITCCKSNVLQSLSEASNNIDVAVVADDCGRQINQHFDLILCNPPFHQGFSTSSALTLKFVEAAQTKLAKNGSAFFVVNAFIGLESIASRYFDSVVSRENNGQFKIIELRHSV